MLWIAGREPDDRFNQVVEDLMAHSQARRSLKNAVAAVAVDLITAQAKQIELLKRWVDKKNDRIASQMNVIKILHGEMLKLSEEVCQLEQSQMEKEQHG